MAVSLVLLAYRLVVLSPLCLNDHLMEWKSQRLMALNGLDERLKTYLSQGVHQPWWWCRAVPAARFGQSVLVQWA